MFPEICQVEINSTGEILGVIVDEIQRVCSLIHGRISTNKSKEYIFDSYDGRSVTILAGPGSVQQYRNNFVKRLAENFYNLKFKYDNLQLPQVSAIEAKMEIIEEFKIYENTYIEIRKLYLQTDFFPVLDAIYNELKAALFDGDNPSKPIRPQS